ncbi:hypothetical protein CKA38_01095 [Ereboglobus luteus]|uniref:HTH arsR-type domain-containing protein n=1 Tax=Ereboglobus luteus TaxID=1796921 RepID=A0A2U8DZM5_9BACT|nr:hypothetical protein CKA38_01095 [Ereboglobus luteus]
MLLIENLGDLLNAMPEAERRNWRGFMQNNPAIATVATSQHLVASLSQHDEVFFGFFDTHHLSPLTSEDARQLLKNLALHGSPSAIRSDKDGKQLADYLDTPQGAARLQAIHHLTGGSPRLYLILADFLTRESLDQLVPAFEKMVDQQLTPYYQERLRWLSPQQREIVEYLCQEQHAIVPVKTIAEALFAEHASISGQLKKLLELGYVKRTPDGRESYYELAEPLMRLSFQVKDVSHHDSSGMNPLRLIVDMLRLWYGQQQLETRLQQAPIGSVERAYLNAALNTCRHSPEGAIENTAPRVLPSEQKQPESKNENVPREDTWVYRGDALDKDAEIEKLTKIISSPATSQKKLVVALSRRGACYYFIGAYAKALADYDQVIDLDSLAQPQILMDVFFYRSLILSNAPDKHLQDFYRFIGLKNANTIFISDESTGLLWSKRLLDTLLSFKKLQIGVSRLLVLSPHGEI